MDGCGKKQELPWILGTVAISRFLCNSNIWIFHLQFLLEEKQQLKESFPDLVRDTPRTAVAEGRFKRLTKKAGTEAVGAMRSILVDVVSEAVKKSIF